MILYQAFEIRRFLGIICMASIATACSANPKAPIEASATKLSQYFEAKKDFARTLQEQLGSTTDLDSYQLVPISGPAYAIGSLVSRDNPLDIQSRECVIDKDKLPEPEPWGAFPTLTSNRSFDFGAGIPPPFFGAFQEAQSTLDLGISSERVADFGISDLSQQLLSKRDVAKLLAKMECLSDMPADGLIIVRGIVYGREMLRSSREFSLGADVTALLGPGGSFTFKYKKSGDFSLEETATSPKFAVYTRVVFRGFDARSAPAAMPASVTPISLPQTSPPSRPDYTTADVAEAFTCEGLYDAPTLADGTCGVAYRVSADRPWAPPRLSVDNAAGVSPDVGPSVGAANGAMVRADPAAAHTNMADPASTAGPSPEKLLDERVDAIFAAIDLVPLTEEELSALTP